MLAIIPARSGSKGLPGKNIKLLNGKPLIAYTIEAALLSTEVSKVIISTDSPVIAKIAMEYGAECPFLRPDYLASDNSKAIDVYLYTLEELNRREGRNIDEFIVLQPTSPLRSAKDIDDAIQIFNSKKADSVVSYCKEAHPIKWHKFLTNEGKFENLFDDTIDNRQNERPTYYPNGSIYVFKTSTLKRGIYYGENSYAYIMDRTRSIDIDDIYDFNYAEFLLTKK